MSQPGPEFAIARPAPPGAAVFWDWRDAGLFLLLALPCLALAAAFSRGLFLLVPGNPGPAAQSLAFQMVAYLLWFVALYWMLKARYQRPFWQSLGWVTRWPRPWLTVFLGPALAISLAILGVLLRAPHVESPIEQLLTDRFSIVLVGLFAATLGPLAEELAFRGFLLPLLLRTFGVTLGVVLCSLPFTLLHGPQYSWSWKHLLLLFCASAVFSLTRIRTGSTAAATLVHATYNLTFFTGFVLNRKDLPL